MAMTRKISISVSLEPHHIERLDEISKKTKIPRSVLVRKGVQNIIGKYEEQLGLTLGTMGPRGKKRGAL